MSSRTSPVLAAPALTPRALTAPVLSDPELRPPALTAPVWPAYTGPAGLDIEAAYRALQSRDRRFDGRIWVGVTSTGIYCRPVCPAQTPKRANVRFFAAPAAAVGAGFRACKRCRPDTAPGTRQWDHRGDLAAQALRLIGEGAVDDGGVAGLANRLHVTPRHLSRVLLAEVGATPLALALSRRAQTARMLVDQTALPLTDVAFAAGFSSIRAFNDVMRREFGCPPSQLRRTVAPDLRADDPALVLRLRFREPYDAAAVGAFLAARAVPSLELHRPGSCW
ncbi:MAG: Ada metal-binding domain-containing protein, partial [Candidatus Nanopelagicales bacterium]